jgi:hypothetical protein
MNNWGFCFDVEEHLEMMEAVIQRVQPRMIIFDPFEKMLGGINLNHDHELRPVLNVLRRWRFQYETAIVLIHHFRKSGHERAGQRMLGSVMFHAWTASALYVSTRAAGDDGDGWKHISLEREFREQAPQPGLKVDLRMGPPGGLEFDAVVGVWNTGDQVLDLVIGAGGRELMSRALEQLPYERKKLSRVVHGHERLILEGSGRRGDPKYIVLTDKDGNVPSA